MHDLDFDLGSDGDCPPTLRILRHGSTIANVAGLRCGGDMDLPMLDVGRAQVEATAQRIVDLDPPVTLIISSGLRRTDESAAIVSRALGGVRIVIEPGFAERRLGEWNMKSVEATRAGLLARETPPGGESDDEFIERVGRAVHRIKPWLALRPLLVGSRGVARAIGELTGLPGRFDLDNGELAEFDLSARPCLETTWGGP